MRGNARHFVKLAFVQQGMILHWTAPTPDENSFPNSLLDLPFF